MRRYASDTVRDVSQYVTERLELLLAAQIDNADGIRHLMMRDPNTGKFERVTGILFKLVT